MKYETYGIKAEGCPFYFKVATFDDLTEIYLVYGSPEVIISHSMQIYNGKSLSRASSVAHCVKFVEMLSRAVFKIEEPTSNTNRKAKNER